MHQPAGELQPTPHSSRVVLDDPRLPVGQIHQREHPGDPLLAEPHRHVVEHAVELQVLVAGQRVIGAGILEHDPDGIPNLTRLPHQVETVHPGGAAGGAEKRGEHEQRGRLAGAVRAQKTEELAFRNFEREIVHGGQIAESLGQVLELDDRHLDARWVKAESTGSLYTVPGRVDTLSPSVYIRSVTAPEHDLAKLRINRDPPPQVRRAFGRTLVIVAVAVVLLVGAFLYFRGSSAPQVQTVVATPISSGGGGGSAATSVTANGYVVARIRASVSAKIPGRLATLTVDGGSQVKRGQVIATLENADYAAAVGEAKANLATARAQVAEAAADSAQSARDARRVTEIHGNDPALVSEQDAENARSKADQAAARTVAAQARVRAAQAALGVAEATLENTYIRAPFTGTVLRKEAEIGEVVAPSVGGGLTRGAVATMADLASLEVEVDVNEAYIGRVSQKQRALITLDAYPDTAFRGEVRQVVPTADRQRATVQVKVSILDHDPRILPEMGARVDFLASDSGASDGPGAASAPPRFRLPAAAVHDAGGKTVVWLVRDGKLQMREVTAGPVSGDFREVTKGLSGGEKIVTGGVEKAEEGMRVK